VADPSEVRAGGAYIEARFDDSKIPGQMREAFARMARATASLAVAVTAPLARGAGVAAAAAAAALSRKIAGTRTFQALSLQANAAFAAVAASAQRLLVPVGAVWQSVGARAAVAYARIGAVADVAYRRIIAGASATVAPIAAGWARVAAQIQRAFIASGAARFFSQVAVGSRTAAAVASTYFASLKKPLLEFGAAAKAVFATVGPVVARSVAGIASVLGKTLSGTIRISSSALSGIGGVMVAGARAAIVATSAVFRGGFRVIIGLAQAMASGVVGAFSRMGSLIQLFASKTIAAMDAASAALRRSGALFQRLGTNLLLFGAAAGTALVAVARGFSTMSEDLLRASQRIGLSVESLQSLRYAAKQLHVDADGLEIAVRRMQGYMLRMAEGAGRGAREFAVLGLNFHQLAQLSPEQQFLTIIGALRQVKDQTLQLALAQKIFGGTSATLGTNVGRIITPLVTSGQSLEQLRDRFKELNLTLDESQIAAGTRLAQAFREIFAQLQALRFQVGAVVTAGLSPYIEKIERILSATIDWVKSHRGLVTTLAASTAAFAGLSLAVGATSLVFGRGLKLIADGVKLLAFVAAPALKLVALAFGLIANPVGFAVAAVALLGYSLVRFTRTGSNVAQVVGNSFAHLGNRIAGSVGSVIGKALDWFAGKLRELGRIASEAFAGIADSLAAGDLKLAAEIAWAAIQAVFARGVAAVKSMMAGLDVVWEAVINRMTVGWIKSVSLMRSVWAKLQKTVADNTAGFIAKQEVAEDVARAVAAENEKRKKKGQAPVSKEEYDKLQADAQSQADKQVAIDQQTSDRKFNEDQDNAKAETDAQLAEARRIHDQRLKEIEDEKNTAVGAAKTQEDQAKAQLDALRKTAAEKRRAAEEEDARRARDFEHSLPRAGEEGDNNATLETLGKAESRSQFSGLNAEFTLGGPHSDAIGKTAENTRRTAVAVEKLASEHPETPAPPAPAPTPTAPAETVPPQSPPIPVPTPVVPVVPAPPSAAGTPAPPEPPAPSGPGSSHVGDENPPSRAETPGEARNRRIRARTIESADARERIRQREAEAAERRRRRYGGVGPTIRPRSVAGPGVVAAISGRQQTAVTANARERIRQRDVSGGILGSLTGITPTARPPRSNAGAGIVAAIAGTAPVRVNVPTPLASGAAPRRFVPPSYANDYLRSIAENSAKQIRLQRDLNQKATPLVATN
jgi:hypothetical protein